MPLTSPAGGAVDLVAEDIITTPTASVQFGSLNLNADKAYTIEFEIIFSYTGVGGWPSIVSPDVNGLGTAGLIYRMNQCQFGCNAFNFIDVNFNSFDSMVGTFTYRRINVLNRAAGLAWQTVWNPGPSEAETGFGEWCNSANLANVTQVGVIVNGATNGIGVGSVFRLYRGSG